jgi:two-component system KDP operon response regulator KdpE
VTPEPAGAPKARILVVDDHPEVVAAFGLYFSEKGFVVRGAASSREAMALVEKEKFDVIFLDNDMPGGTGLQAIAGLSRRSGAPIIMISGHYDPDLKKDALLLGALDCLAKPPDFPDLEKRISALKP